MPEINKTREELERGKIELKIQALKGQVMAQYELTTIQLNEISKIGKDTLDQAKRTNGRVDRAEAAIIDLKTHLTKKIEEVEETASEKIKAVDEATAAGLKVVLKDTEIFGLFRRKKWLLLPLSLGAVQIYKGLAAIDVPWVLKYLISLF